MESLDLWGLPLVESAPAGEFFFTHIGKIEPAGDGCLRFYCCVKKGGILDVKFTAVMPISSVIIAAKQAIRAASELHNDMQFQMDLTAH